MEFMKKFRIGSGSQNFHIHTPLQGSLDSVARARTIYFLHLKCHVTRNNNNNNNNNDITSLLQTRGPYRRDHRHKSRKNGSPHSSAICIWPWRGAKHLSSPQLYCHSQDHKQWLVVQ